MIIPVIMFVPDQRPLVSMLEFGEHDDIDEIAQIAAATFPDTNYFFAEMVIDAPKPEFWPELEIKWTNWYGKVVTDNTYAHYAAGLTEQIRLSEDELRWFLNSHPSSILFVLEDA